MRIKYYIDPDTDPWITEENGGYLVGARTATIPIEGDGYRIMLHFGRANPSSGKFYLIKAESEWKDDYMNATKEMLG